MDWTTIIMAAVAVVLTIVINKIPKRLDRLGNLIDIINMARSDGRITLSELRQILQALRQLIDRVETQDKIEKQGKK